ncbi:hypothetical protein L6452_35941 [Arctium lappa]|uniref:Uncharacterized protein n=1 Tax=Arctium lappa TaxID=4217 RepID=A0ACB8Y9B1_ARCLA|nr:hypothetical protein L6452_35941 [Arctium lappa]
MIEKSRSIASLEQMTYGKDLSSPLTPVVLAKNQQEGSSSSSLDSLNLRPNGEIHLPLKPKVNTLVHSQECLGAKAYYVVFNGPKADIYTSWNIAEKAVKEISGVKHKKYKSYDEARVSANIYTAAEYKPPIELISSSEGLRPTFSTVLTIEKDSKVKLGTIPKKTQHATQKLLEDMEDYDLDSSYTGFKYLYKKGREMTKLSFVEEHYYTSDKRNISYFSFYPNAHPDSLIFWDDNEEPIQTYKYVQIGVSKDKIYAPSQAKDALLEKEDLQEVAEQKLLTLIGKVFDISKEDKLKGIGLHLESTAQAGGRLREIKKHPWIVSKFGMKS